MRTNIIERIHIKNTNRYHIRTLARLWQNDTFQVASDVYTNIIERMDINNTIQIGTISKITYNTRVMCMIVYT